MNDCTQPRLQKARFSVALLIDGENIPARLIPWLLAEAEAWGDVTIRRVYGDWASSRMRPWREVMPEHGLRAIHYAQPKKNGTDMALTVDALELFTRGVRCFCLCSGDSDYVPLVLWLREQGCIVVVIGQDHASLALQHACSQFVSSPVLDSTGESETVTPENSTLPRQNIPPPKRQTHIRSRGNKQRARSPAPRLFSKGGNGS